MSDITVDSLRGLLQYWSTPTEFSAHVDVLLKRGDIDSRLFADSKAAQNQLSGAIDKLIPDWQETSAMSAYCKGDGDNAAVRLSMSRATFFRRLRAELEMVAKFLNERVRAKVFWLPQATTPAALIEVRTTELSKLVDLLTGDLSRRRAAIVGPFGSGKTTLAMLCAQDARINKSYPDGVLAIRLPADADPKTAFAEAVFHFFSVLFPPLGDGVAEMTFARSLLATKRVLVVCDDVDSTEMCAFASALGDQCACLITTAFPDVAVKFSNGRLVDLKPLVPSDVMRVIRSRVQDRIIQDAGIDVTRFWSTVEPLVATEHPWQAVVVAARLTSAILADTGPHRETTILDAVVGPVEPSDAFATDPGSQVVELIRRIAPDSVNALWIFRHLPVFPAPLPRSLLERYFAGLPSGERVFRLLRDVDALRQPSESALCSSVLLRGIGGGVPVGDDTTRARWLADCVNVITMQPGYETLAASLLPLAIQLRSGELAALLAYVDTGAESVDAWVLDIRALEDCIDVVQEKDAVVFARVAMPLLQRRGKAEGATRVLDRLARLEAAGGKSDHSMVRDMLAFFSDARSGSADSIEAHHPIAEANWQFVDASSRRLGFSAIATFLLRSQVDAMRNLLLRITPPGIEDRFPHEGTHVAAVALIWLDYVNGIDVHQCISQMEASVAKCTLRGFEGGMHFGRAALSWMLHFQGRYKESSKMLAQVDRSVLASSVPVMVQLARSVEILNALAAGYLDDARVAATEALAVASKQGQWLDAVSFATSLARIELDDGNCEIALGHGKRAIKIAKQLHNNGFIACASGIAAAAIVRAGADPSLLLAEGGRVQVKVDPWCRLNWLTYAAEADIGRSGGANSMVVVNEATRLARSLQCPEYEARSIFVKAKILLAQNRYLEAQQVGQEAIDLLGGIDHSFQRVVYSWLLDHQLMEFNVERSGPGRHF